MMFKLEMCTGKLEAPTRIQLSGKVITGVKLRDGIEVKTVDQVAV